MHTHADSSDFLVSIVHLYLSVCETATGDQELHKRQLAVRLSQQWAPECDPAEVEAVVDTAFVAARSGFSETAETIAETLHNELSPEMCARLLTELGLLACADGHLTRQEARVISLVRMAFQGQLHGHRPLASA